MLARRLDAELAAHTEAAEARVHPFQAGFASFTPSFPVKSIDALMHLCPYKAGTQEAIDWWSGWQCAASAIDYSLGIVHQGG